MALGTPPVRISAGDALDSCDGPQAGKSSWRASSFARKHVTACAECSGRTWWVQRWEMHLWWYVCMFVSMYSTMF